MSSPWIMRSQTDMNTNREVWYNQGQQDETVRGRIQCELKERPNGTQNHNKCGLLICHLRHGTNASISSQRLQRKRKGSINTPKRNYDLFYKYTESIIQLIMFIRYAGSVAVWIRIRWLWWFCCWCCWYWSGAIGWNPAAISLSLPSQNPFIQQTLFHPSNQRRMGEKISQDGILYCGGWVWIISKIPSRHRWSSFRCERVAYARIIWFNAVHKVGFERLWAFVSTIHERCETAMRPNKEWLIKNEKRKCDNRHDIIIMCFCDSFSHSPPFLSSRDCKQHH